MVLRKKQTVDGGVVFLPLKNSNYNIKGYLGYIRVAYFFRVFSLILGLFFIFLFLTDYFIYLAQNFCFFPKKTFFCATVFIRSADSSIG
jgi:hypothetical protein